jgi:hypothetical protein
MILSFFRRRLLFLLFSVILLSYSGYSEDGDEIGSDHHNESINIVPSTDFVKLVVLNITEQGKKVQCNSSATCKYKTFFGMRISRSSMVDNKRKILMEFSPKADCTTFVALFLNDVGFRYGIEYTGWPHTFREEYYNKQCGKATPCMFYRPDWFRFKVVRNPFDRAVSSFIHIMKYPSLGEKIIPTKERTTLTFAKYVAILEKFPTKDLQGFAGAHGGLQSQPYERHYYRTNTTVFHETVQAENPHETLERINRRLGTNFSAGFRAHHFAERNSAAKKFVGKTPWNLLANQIPASYGCFYNHELRLRVHHVFLWDILLYNYSFPYQLPLPA